jgi:hypothetical protein
MAYYLCHIYSRKERENPSLFQYFQGNFSGLVNQLVDTDGTRESIFFALPPLQVPMLCLMVAQAFCLSQVVLVGKYQDHALRLAHPDKSRLATTFEVTDKTINVPRQ